MSRIVSAILLVLAFAVVFPTIGNAQESEVSEFLITQEEYQTFDRPSCSGVTFGIARMPSRGSPGNMILWIEQGRSTFRIDLPVDQGSGYACLPLEWNPRAESTITLLSLESESGLKTIMPPLEIGENFLLSREPGMYNPFPVLLTRGELPFTIRI